MIVRNRGAIVLALPWACLAWPTAVGISVNFISLDLAILNGLIWSLILIWRGFTVKLEILPDSVLIRNICRSYRLEKSEVRSWGLVRVYVGGQAVDGQCLGAVGGRRTWKALATFRFHRARALNVERAVREVWRDGRHSDGLRH